MINQSKELSEIFMSLGFLQDRMGLLEQSLNQQSILLDAVLDMLEKSMDEN